MQLLVFIVYVYKKSPANAMGNAQQRCMFESRVKQNLSQSPKGARRPAAKLSIVFYSYSPQGATCLAQPTPYRLKVANFFYPSHSALSFGVTPFEFMEKLYGS